MTKKELLDLLDRFEDETNTIVNLIASEDPIREIKGVTLREINPKNKDEVICIDCH